MIYRKEKNNISLKEINKKNILKIVMEMGPISRIDISRHLKISRPTTSAYIGELIKDGLIEEIGKGDSTPSGGKKAVLLQFNSRAGYILGVMIGVKTIRIALTDLGSNIIEIIKILTEEWLGPDAVIDKLVKNLKKIIRKSKISKEEIIGIGIGSSGLVDSKKGLVIFSPNLDGWNNIKLKEIVEEKIGLPTFIENECRVQAIAEKKYGLAKDIKNFVCVETGTGIGTGVFIDNKLVSGDKGMAGEVGHIITNLAGNRVCHCGNIGCLETLCSTSSLLEDIVNDIKKRGKSSKYSESGLKLEDLSSLYDQGDEIVTRNVEKNAEYLGIGISNTIKMFNPELIIIHGEIIKFGEKYLKKVKESVSKNTFPKVKDNYNIQFSKLGENVGLIGATSIVFDNIFDLDSSNIAGQYIIKKRIN
ncbi:MAG: ROK family transcriptional regulator [Actinobacteria bacterium]|nr:ROK family transcriptional regulator [Actinomycetota bacterium]MBL7123409.1 ROK family transcriptional regulator [Actinomycetota bacterium]